MICPSCQTPNPADAETCFRCGRAFYTVVQGTLLSGRYEIRTRLGRGGMGVVYTAWDQQLDEIVALKLLRGDIAGTPLSLKRFKSEIKLARRVTHTNVCRIHEYGEDGGLRYIVMEFIEGNDLRRVLEGRQLMPAEALNIALQVGDGLQAIHDAGVIHRDLKTPNIMLTPRGIAKLMDFGIAKEWGVADSTGGTATGQIVGTPEYMSPEQIRGEKLDFRSDVYALGVVVFELFTRRVPFKGDTPVSTILKHLHDPPPLSASDTRLPAPLIPVLERALAKHADQRYASAGQMVAALRGTAGALDDAIATVVVPLAPPARRAPPSPLDAPAPRPRRPTPMPLRPGPAPSGTRWGWALALVGVAVLAFAATGAWLARGLWLDQPRQATQTPPAPVSVVTLPVTTQPPTPAPSSEPTPAQPTPTPQKAPVAAATLAAPPRASPAIAASLRPPTPSPRPVEQPTPRDSPTPAPAPAATLPPEAGTERRAAQETGFLQVMVTPWAEVGVDGASHGTTPLARIPLAPGPHAVSLTHPNYEAVRRRVTIRSGETVRLNIDLADEALPR